MNICSSIASLRVCEAKRSKRSKRAVYQLFYDCSQTRINLIIDIIYNKDLTILIVLLQVFQHSKRSWNALLGSWEHPSAPTIP